MSISIGNNTNPYTNIYMQKTSKSESIVVYSPVDAMEKTSSFVNDSPDTLVGPPEEGLKKENRLGQIHFVNDTHAVVYKDENFSEKNPVVSVYSKRAGYNEWDKIVVNLNTVNKNDMSVLEAYGVGNALEVLGKTDMHGVIRLVSGFNEMNEFSTNYSYESLFNKYNVKSIFADQMQTQYKSGNLKGYYYFKQVYDTYFAD